MGKRLGQHFLHDPAVLDAIVVAAALRPGEPVLEIGPGRGVLTERLLAQGVRLTAVELDPALLEGLRARWGGDSPLRLVEGDALKIDLSPQVLFGAEEPYAVVANLPYYLSTPLLFRLAAARRLLTRLVVMVQHEVAARITAGPEDGKAYGSLSVAMQSVFQARMVRRVPPSAFHPPPQVASAVVALTPRPPLLPEALEVAFLAHVKGLFTRRRKLMLSGLRGAQGVLAPSTWEALESLVAARRAETLTPAEHLQVFRLLHDLPASGA